MDRETVLKRALVEIKKLRGRVAELEARQQALNEPAAIVGMACRLPGGAQDPESFWHLLSRAGNAVTEVPAERWDTGAFYQDEPEPGKSYVRRAGFLDDVAGFDAGFFGLSPREVRRMDPQQRLLMEVAWESLERAGQPLEQLAGSATGVFVGNTTSDYSHLQMKYVDLARLDAHYLTGNSPSFLAGRISYLLGLRGPTLTVDTSCSSSLVAVHLACRSLRQGECDLALAGGVNLILLPELNVSLCGARMLAADGRCKTFDAAADGYGRGEGCAMVVLKTLSRARQDRDPILAVVRGSAINHDGKSSGITVPSGKAQQEVLRRALADAGLAPHEVGYVEAHGTGTSLGDPIEVRALGAVLGEGRQEDSPLLIGSVKTNFGHLEGAAGVAGLIKAVLALEHGEIPPHLHLDRLNPAIELDEIPARITTEATPWPAGNGRRIAGVSSFGASGTNAHLLVEEAPPEPAAGAAELSGAAPSRHLLVLSARSPAALRQHASRFARHLETHPGEALADVCYTANSGRLHAARRLAVEDASPAGMAAKLAAFAAQEPESGVISRQATGGAAGPGRVAFLFTGQGSQYTGMGRELYETQPVMRRTLERCAELLRLDRPLLEVLFEAEAGALLDQTAYTQPALFALEYALAELWRSWGVEPVAVLGHSVGEYVAACVAGVLSLEDALLLVAERGRLMQSLPSGGAMAAVELDEERAAAAVSEHSDQLSIAAVNSPDSVVLSGPLGILRPVVQKLAADGARTKMLKVSHAFHSPLMDPILDELEAAAAGVRYRTPRIDVISNLSGRAAGPEELARPDYWRRHLRGTVRFGQSIESLAELGVEILIEAGPAPTLLGMARRCPGTAGEDQLLVPSLRQGRDEWQQMLRGLGALYVRGVQVDWQGFHHGRTPRRLILPTSPFERRRFWIEPEELARTPAASSLAALAAEAGTGGPSAARHPFVGRRLASPLDEVQFEARFSTELQPLLGDFALFGHVAVNIGVYVESFVAAVREELEVSSPVFEEILMPQALLLPPGETRRVQLVLGAGDAGGRPLSVFGQSGDGSDAHSWALYAAARLDTSEDREAPPGLSPDDLRPAGAAELTGDDFYAAMESRGLALGPAARWIEHVWPGTEGGGAALCRMRLPVESDRSRAYALHPGIVDCCFQLFFAALPATADPQAIYMLMGVERLRFFGRYAGDESPLWCRVRREQVSESAESIHGDVVLVEEDGRAVMEIRGADMKRVSRAALERSLSATGRPPARRSGAGRPDPEAIRRQVLALPPAERPQRVRERIAARVAGVLGFGAAELDFGQPLNELGIDSLMALELRGAIAEELGTTLPLAVLIEGPSLSQLSERLLAEIEAGVEEAPEHGEDGAAAPAHVLPPVVPDPENRYEPFAFTDLQEAYFFGRTGVFELGNISTYITLEVDLADLDFARLNRAWQRMIERHEMLRAVFLRDGRQRILPAAPARYDIRFLDLAGLAGTAVQEQLTAIRRQMGRQVLPTDRWPLFDLRVSRTSECSFRLHVGLDALVMDAWGTSVVFKEWAALYHRPDLELPPLEVSFRDYALALKALEETALYRRSLDYWKGRLADLPPAPELPLVGDPAALSRPEFVRRSGRLEAEAWQRLKARAAAAGLTPSAMMCTLYATVLAEWSKSRRFTLNVLYFNRLPLHPRVTEVVANLSATILLEVDLTRQAPFLERARSLARRFWDDLEHSYVTGVRVLREYNRLHAGRAQAAMPVVFASTLALDVRQQDVPSGLFQHLLSLGTASRVVHTSARTPQVMLDHQIMEEAGALVFNWDVVEKLFPEGLVDDMFAAYCRLLDRLAHDDETWQLTEHALVPAAQLAAQAAVNATEAPLPAGLLHQPFLEQAARHPGRPAVICGDRILSYGQLEYRARLLGHRLREEGARPNELIAVVLEKGCEQVVATFGVLLSGAAYLPIDPGLPAERVRYLLEHGRVRIALLAPGTDPPAAAGWPSGVRRLVVEDREVEEVAPLAPVQGPEDLAYVIFTSGSTGLPKGVMIDHRSALNTVVDVNRRFGVGPEDRVLALSALSFDLSVYDLFGLLAAGGAVVLPEPEALREPGRWTELVGEHRVTLWNSVPALMEMWVDSHAGGDRGGKSSSLRVALLSGDWIPVSLPDRIRKLTPGAQVVSLGGATEVSIWSIFHPVEEVDPQGASIPYGRPLDNQQFHVLDANLRPRPFWVPGDLYIGGAGLARGYWRDEERTRESFICHPLSGERLYKTGDLGRYLPGGDIEFLGREDFQVKVQGYRIELGEIETTLARHAAVASCVVAAHGAKRGSKRLVAHVVPAEEGDPPPTLGAELSEYLAEKLASYMVPSAFVFLAALPLTPNGKVDRGALAEPGEGVAAGAGAAAVPPRDELESELTELWQELLATGPIGIRDDFFDLGGHSLLAVRLMSAIEESFGRQLSLSILFEGRTVEYLAGVLREDTPTPPRTVLVGIRPAGGSRPPLFCVHPVSGSVLCYADLARCLGDDQPFYGLQSPEAKSVPASVEEMAARYCDAVRGLRPHGPYHLAGWSMGGVVAFEMAQQLLRQRQEVAFLGLVDVAQMPNREGPAEVDDATLAAWFARDLAGLTGQEPTLPAAELRALDEPRRLERLTAWTTSSGVLPSGIGAARIAELFETFRRNYRALLAYVPEAYPRRLTLWAASETPGEATRGWAALAASGATVHEITGDHYSIVRMPAVGDLAGHLRLCIDDTEERREEPAGISPAAPGGGLRS